MIEGSLSNDLALLYVDDNKHITFFGGKHLSSSGKVKHQLISIHIPALFSHGS